MDFNIPTGLTLESSKTVKSSDSAISYGSGMVNVFATPAMLAFVEKTCMNLLLPHLPENYNSVGVEVNLSHLKASAIGKQVNCIAEIAEVSQRKIIFNFKVFEGDILVGAGSHTRFIINVEKFMSKLEQ